MKLQRRLNADAQVHGPRTELRFSDGLVVDATTCPLFVHARWHWRADASCRCTSEDLAAAATLATERGNVTRGRQLAEAAALRHVAEQLAGGRVIADVHEADVLDKNVVDEEEERGRYDEWPGVWNEDAERWDGIPEHER